MTTLIGIFSFLGEILLCIDNYWNITNQFEIPTGEIVEFLSTTFKEGSKIPIQQPLPRNFETPEVATILKLTSISLIDSKIYYGFYL